MTRRAEVCLETPGTTLFALDQGSGLPLVFFHGGLADHRAALLHVGALTDRLRVITPDLRGAGRSHWGGELSWQVLADDALALLRHLDLERAVIGGVSMGSAVALRMALSHPDAVAGLVLVHPAFAAADHGLAEAQRVGLSAMDAVGRRAPVEGIAVLHPLFDALPEPIRGRARAMVESFDPESVAATTRFLASGTMPCGSTKELCAIRCPTLIIPGVDPTHPVEVARLLAETIPDARMQAASDVGKAVVRFCLEQVTPPVEGSVRASF